jgi:RHS repeat-associated protein
MTADGLGNTFTYDAENRLVSVGGNYSLSYAYDASGNRVEETNGSTSDGLIYDLNGRLLQSFTSSGQVITEEGYAGGEHLFTYTPSGYTRFYYRDWLETLRTFTTYATSGSTVNGSCVSFAFGDGLVCKGSVYEDGTDFTGQRVDPEGQTHFTFRQYSPVQGRWTVPDPAGLAAVDSTNPQSWNRYAYVLNNPLRNIDPTGLECVWDDGSFDSADDPKTGSVGGCQGQGGTWVELGQNGNWSGQADAANAALVSSIQNGLVGSVGIMGADGQQYSTYYNGSGQATETITPSGTTFYLYGGQGDDGGWIPGPDPGAVANSMNRYVKARTSDCYNGFHKTPFGRVTQAFSALALLPVASNYQDNRLTLGAEILGKLSAAAGSNSAGAVFTPLLETFTAEVTTPLYILGTGTDAGGLLLCGASAATSIVR